ncbi:MAG UNVERIFIED_CONTAM: hypothetical protein LVR18_21740 [Planctomycetaceae bacterium]|jgi:hypothetical protein
MLAWLHLTKTCCAADEQNGTGTGSLFTGCEQIPGSGDVGVDDQRYIEGIRTRREVQHSIRPKVVDGAANVLTIADVSAEPLIHLTGVPPSTTESPDLDLGLGTENRHGVAS